MNICSFHLVVNWFEVISAFWSWPSFSPPSASRGPSGHQEQQPLTHVISHVAVSGWMTLQHVDLGGRGLTTVWLMITIPLWSRITYELSNPLYIFRLQNISQLSWFPRTLLHFFYLFTGNFVRHPPPKPKNKQINKPWNSQIIIVKIVQLTTRVVWVHFINFPPAPPFNHPFQPLAVILGTAAILQYITFKMSLALN